MCLKRPPDQPFSTLEKPTFKLIFNLIFYWNIYYFIFQWKNYSIFNNSYIIILNRANHPSSSLFIKGFPIGTKNSMGCTMVWKISTWQTKQINKAYKTTNYFLNILICFDITTWKLNKFGSAFLITFLFTIQKLQRSFAIHINMNTRNNDNCEWGRNFFSFSFYYTYTNSSKGFIKLFACNDKSLGWCFYVSWFFEPNWKLPFIQSHSLNWFTQVLQKIMIYWTLHCAFKMKTHTQM
jgi:hypothetical protein